VPRGLRPQPTRGWHGQGAPGPFYQKAHLEGGAKVRWRQERLLLHYVDGAVAVTPSHTIMLDRCVRCREHRPCGAGILAVEGSALSRGLSKHTPEHRHAQSHTPTSFHQMPPRAAAAAASPSTPWTGTGTGTAQLTLECVLAQRAAKSFEKIPGLLGRSEPTICATRTPELPPISKRWDFGRCG